MDTDYIWQLLFAPTSDHGPIFSNQKDAAREIELTGAMTSGSAESAFARLFKEGRFSRLLRTSLLGVTRNRALQVLGKEGAEQLCQQLEDGLSALVDARIKPRFPSARQSEALVANRDAETASSIMLVLATVAVDGDGEAFREVRHQIAYKTDLPNPNRRPIMRVWCFAERTDALMWLHALVWESAKMAAGSNTKLIPKLAPQMADAAVGMQKSGLLQIKLLRPRACLANAVLQNFTGPIGLSGSVWFYDRDGNARDFHVLEGRYLNHWEQFARDVLADEPAVVSDAQIWIQDLKQRILDLGAIRTTPVPHASKTEPTPQ